METQHVLPSLLPEAPGGVHAGDEVRVPLDVELWLLDSQDSASLARVSGALPGVEKRPDGPVSARNVRRTAVDTCLRLALTSVHPRIAPAAWAFSRTAHGKPYIAAGPDTGFSITHTDGLSAIAVARVPGIGADAECLSRAVPLDGMESFLAPREIALLNATAEDAKQAVFLRLWTLKEAFVKATGAGLNADLAAIDASAAAPDRATVLHIDGRRSLLFTLELGSLACRLPGWLSVCILEPPACAAVRVNAERPAVWPQAF